MESGAWALGRTIGYPDERASAASAKAVEHIVRPSRMIAAEPGTRLAYAYETESGPEIGYAKVICFVERGNEIWGPLIVRDGEPRLSDCVGEFVLMPGESLSELACDGMRRRLVEDLELSRRRSAASG
jgi:hypothetical protein